MTFHVVNETTVMIQLTVALVCGAVLGFERLLAGKEAGMRTFGLVSIGSCLFVIVGTIIGGEYAGLKLNGMDPLRMASAVVSGIGFLGAGLIIFQHELKGLTTAAVLWVASAIGVSIGFELYTIAIFTTCLTLFVTVGLWFVEHYLEQKVALRKKE